MDVKGQLTRNMINTAVKRGIADVIEDPKRAIRHLVDLGDQVATGHFQQEFFGIANQILHKDDSPYYCLLQDVASHVDAQILQCFGVNLGYNSWTYGANMIRKYERERGHNIPWTIVFDGREETSATVSYEDISNLISSGESMGIYCYMFFGGGNKKRAHALIHTLKFHGDCCYFLFLEPKTISNALVDACVDARNIVVVLAADVQEDDRAIERAAALLREKRCLYGAYGLYDDTNIESVISESYIRKKLNLHCSFLFLIQKGSVSQEKQARFTAFMKTAKYANEHPLFMVDFYRDLAYVDRVISVEDCFVAVKSNGDIAVENMDNVQKGLNIKTHTLKQILRQSMPKTKYVHSDS